MSYKKLLCLGVGFVLGLATPVQADEMDDLYKRILENPTDVELNIEYARLAEKDKDGKSGLRKSLAAYQRILLIDPDNKNAQNEVARLKRLLALPKTNFIAIFGLSHESNTPRRDSSFLSYNDTVASMALSVEDKRVVGKTLPYESNVLFSGNLHNRYRLGDVAVFSIDSGPVWDFGKDWELRTAAVYRHARLQTEGLSNYGGGVFTLKPQQTGALQFIKLDIGYEKYFGRIPNRDGLMINLEASWTQQGIFEDEAVLLFKPSINYNGAKGLKGRNRYKGIGSRVDWIAPLKSVVGVGGKSMFLSVDASIQHRRYQGKPIGLKKNRHDIHFSGGLKGIFQDAFTEKGSLILSYQAERNNSNDDDKGYKNHVIALNTIWEF